MDPRVCRIECVCAISTVKEHAIAISCNCVSKVGVLEQWISRGLFLMPGRLERDAYSKLQRGLGEDNVAWAILKPIYCAGTSCK